MIESFEKSRVVSTEDICPDYYYQVTTIFDDPIDPEVFDYTAGSNKLQIYSNKVEKAGLQ